MKSLIFIILLSLSGFLVYCSDEGVSYTPTDNTIKTDTMKCLIRGDSLVGFFTTAVNREDYPKPDSSRVIISGTMIVNQFELYAVYIAFTKTGDQPKSYSLSGTDGITRCEKIFGSTTIKQVYSYDVSGSVDISQISDSRIDGTFSFSAKTIDKKLSVSIENGTFTYKVKH